MGRPRTYSDETDQEILRRLAEGETLTQICRDEHLPTEAAIRKRALTEPFGSLYVRAREIGYMRMADELTEIADDARNDWMERETKNGTITVVNDEAVKRSELRINTRKWLLSKALPKVFGDRIQVDQHVSISDEFEKFVRELKRGDHAKVIENSPMNGHLRDSRKSDAIEIVDESVPANTKANLR
jgi:hypothetical protein